MNRSNDHRFYGPLPRDCWELTGKRCTLTSKMKIAATCTKLRDQYFQHFALEKWLYYMKPRRYNIYNEGLRRAAAAGERQLVDFFISKGACYWNWALGGAAIGGHRDLVDFFISKGATLFESALQRAKAAGHQDLIDFFKSKISALQPN